MDKIRPFLTAPAVIDWLQWNEFNLKMNEPDYPQLALSLIAEYKTAIKNLKVQRDNATRMQITLSKERQDELIKQFDKELEQLLRKK